MFKAAQEQKMSIIHDLDTQGYAVIRDVISPADCDELVAKYQAWLSLFEDGDYPKNRRSVIHGYGVSNMDPTWRIRLKAKPVFEAIYGTTKLLSSTDGIGLLPPGKVKADFDTGIYWFHCDQACDKVGCHSFQGAVYLEETTPEDYCFRVLKGSHRKHQEFFTNPRHERAKRKSLKMEFCKFTKAERQWFLDQGCDVTHVPVPKGGMVVWDSRTIHDTKRPSKNRANPERWRMLAFVSMAPAAWTTPKDLSVKKTAYNNLETTAHWASRGATILKFMGMGNHSNIEDVRLKELPPIAKTKEVRLLAGIEPYDFEDGQPNGPPAPKMKSDDGGQWDSCSTFTYLGVDQSQPSVPSATATPIGEDLETPANGNSACRSDDSTLLENAVTQDDVTTNGVVDDELGLPMKRKAEDN